MKFRALVDVQIWRNVMLGFPSGKIDILRAGKVVSFIRSMGQYGFIESPSRGWVNMTKFSLVIEEPTPPPLGSSIYLTIRGDRKPVGYKPEGINYGSFDIGWLMDAPKLEKPANIRIEQKHIDYIRLFNPGQEEKAVTWLVDQAGTRAILSVDENDNYRLPVPCFSGDNLVRVLEWRGIFARIETVNINADLPTTLPAYLLHTWGAFTKGGAWFQPLGGVRYPLFARASSAWVQVKGLVT